MSGKQIPFFKEKIDHLFLNQNLGHLATIINAMILVWIQWNTGEKPLIVTWCLALILTIVVRSMLFKKYKKNVKSSSNLIWWYRFYLTGLFISGAIWGSAGIFLHSGSSPVLEMVTLFTIGGMVAGASAVYSPLISAYFAFSLPAILPAIIHCLIHGKNEYFSMGIMLFVFLVIMSITCNRNRKVFESSLKLKTENNDLINYLSKANSDIEKSNRQLVDENRQRKEIEQELQKHQITLESRIEKRTAELVQRNKELNVEILERKKAELAFKSSEERYRILVENAMVGILLIRDSKIIFANPISSKICGYEQKEIINRSFLDFVHPDDHELAVSNYGRRMKGEKVEDNYPIRIINKEGETRWVQINAIRMVYDDKQTILSLFKDITQERYLEMQAIQSEKMASIGQLAAGVAHEINNPIGFVSSNLHTLAEYQELLHKLITYYIEFTHSIKNQSKNGYDEEISIKLQEITRTEKEIDIDFILDDFPSLISESREGVERVKKIVSDLKNFAHPGSDKMQLADINSNIESTLNMVWNELKYHVEVIKNLNDIPKIGCYPQQLNQVFMNLFVNAAQAIEDKGTIRIETLSRDNNIEINISDTGAGIPKDNLNRIFDPFFTTKEVGKGTGLGLNVCYNIVKKHQGTITVESDVGKGTTFTITLPSSQIEQ